MAARNDWPLPACKVTIFPAARKGKIPRIKRSNNCTRRHDSQFPVQRFGLVDGPKPPTFLQPEALLALLEKHKRRGMNALIKGNLKVLDPVIGDASCEMRPPLLISLYVKLQAHFTKEGSLDAVLDLVAAYEDTHKSDKVDTKVKTVADVMGTGQHPAEYDYLFNELVKLLGDKSVEFLGLCFSLSVSCIWTREEFDVPFFFQSTGIYQISTPAAEAAKDAKLRINREPGLRRKLATFAMEAFVELVKALPHNDTNRTAVSTVPTKRHYIEDQLVEAAHFMRTTLKVDGENDLPLMAIYPQFRILLSHLFHASIPIIVSVRRLALLTVKAPAPADPLENAEIIPATNFAQYNYSLGDMRAIFYAPDAATGKYKPIVDVPSDQANTPCLVIEAFSVYHEDSALPGLDGANHDAYFDHLTKCDIAWLIATYAAGHPAFAGNAHDGTHTTVPIYSAVCEQQSASFKFSREECEGMNLNMHVDGENRPTLHSEWVRAREMALVRGLTKCQCVGQGPHGYVRINHPVDFQVDHVKAMKLEQVKAECTQLLTKHSKASGAVFGSFIVRIGSLGVSCTDSGFADRLSGQRVDKHKREVYLEEYPGNAVFLSK